MSNSLVYCIIGYEVCNISNAYEYAFDLINYDYVMIGKDLDYGVDIIKLDKEIINFIKLNSFVNNYKIIQVIKATYASEINNMMYNVPDVLLKPQIYFGLKDANCTTNDYIFEQRYETIPF